MEDINTVIDIAAVAILFIFLLVKKSKGKKETQATKIAPISKIAILVGILLGERNTTLGYVCIGAGVLLGLIDMILVLSKK